MNGFEVIGNLVNLASRIPFERFFFRSSDKDLDELEERLKQKGLLTHTTKAKIPPEKQNQGKTLGEGENPQILANKVASLSEESIEAGKSCSICSDEHLSRVSGALSEALRFARDKGMKDLEVLRRIRHARDELNTMERFDLSPEGIVKLSEPEQEIARWALSKSRDLRHQINALIAGSPGDLEKVAANAAKIADEFMKKVWGLPQEIREGCPVCESLQTLKEYVEKRKQGGSNVSTTVS